jgi:hypothetical protein
MQFHALIEEWPSESMVYFRELPGCLSAASTSEAALQGTPTVVEDYFRWLKKNEIVLFEEEVNPLNVVLAERLKSIEPDSGPLFATDRAAPDDLEIDNALNVAATARALIIELVAEVPPHLHNQAPTPGNWSLTEHLEHIMECETWYVSRLAEQPASEQPAQTMDADTISMKIFENAMDFEIVLRNLTPEQRTRVFVHEGEEWTAAKVLRRMTGHLREHYPWMQELARQLTV